MAELDDHQTWGFVSLTLALNFAVGSLGNAGV